MLSEGIRDLENFRKFIAQERQIWGLAHLVRESLSHSRALWVWYHADRLVKHTEIEPLKYHT